MNENLEKMQSQLHHVIVILTESIKFNMSKAKETKLARDNRVKLLL